MTLHEKFLEKPFIWGHEIHEKNQNMRKRFLIYCFLYFEEERRRIDRIQIFDFDDKIRWKIRIKISSCTIRLRRQKVYIIYKED
jgi:hypothetical protein